MSVAFQEEDLMGLNLNKNEDSTRSVIVYNLSATLSSMGFKGSLLRDLLDLIVDKDSLYSFYNFILKTEEEEGAITKVLLVHRFIKYMQDKQSFANQNEFITAYIKANTTFDKENVLAKLFVSSHEILSKVVFWIDNKMISLIRLYQLAVKYRSQYSVGESLFLIESMYLDVKCYSNPFSTYNKSHP